MIAVRLDKFPTLIQKNIIRLLQHTHFVDFPSPGIWGVEQPKDLFLQQPEVEADHRCHQQQQYEIQRQQIMPPQTSQQIPQQNIHQQPIFSPGMGANSQMPLTPATPSGKCLMFRCLKSI